MDIARDHSLGYDEILEANPSVDRWLPGDGTPVMLPTRYILPDAPREGIVLNLAEKRLYYYPKPTAGEKPYVLTFPVGIGRMDWETPLGTTRIVEKVKDPTWRPPASIKAEHLERYGEILPDVVPAGPDNPMGAYALRLGIPGGYAIHGTNKRDGVGSRVSHGCMRLYPENIEELFRIVPIGTKVTIINQPIKTGWYAGTLFLEAHPPFIDDEEEDARAPNHATLANALEVIRQRVGPETALLIDSQRLQGLLDEANGVPVPVLN
jgi:L,D-transpeptidase ErfK/SrfK